MNDLEVRNVVVYGMLTILAVTLTLLSYAIGAGTLPGFREGEALAGASGAVVTLLAGLLTPLTMYLAANRPRLGSARLAADVDRKRERGVSRTEMTVVNADDLAALTKLHRDAAEGGR